MRLTEYGKDVWLPATGIAIVIEVVIALLWIFLSNMGFTLAISLFLVVALIWLLVVGFFRDPERSPKGAMNECLFSPADGTVRDIQLLKNTMVDPNSQEEREIMEKDKSFTPELRELFKGTDVIRIGIFLSVFSVHVNRVPTKMKVLQKIEKNGEFFDARDPRALTDNEAVTIGGEGEIGNLKFPMAIKQVSGAIARRIVCPVEIGQIFQSCDIYGMIKFGSRTELYLPCSLFEVLVSCGDGVRGGETAIVRIKKQENNEQEA